MPEKTCFFKRRCYWIYLLLIGFIFSLSHQAMASDEAQLARQFSLIQQTRHPEISSDGKSVAFLWDITGQTQVWVYEINRPFPTQVTFFDQPVESVKWIPKSEELVVSVRNSFGNTALYRVDRFGYKLTPLSDKPRATFIVKAFSNDGQKLAYTSNMREPAILDAYLLDLKSNISTLIAAENVPVQPVSFSPNGSQLLISKGYPEIQNHLFLVDTKSLKQIRLTDKRVKARYEGGDWTPDGKGFYTATTYKRNQKTLALISLQKRRRKIVRGKISPINLGQSCLISYNLSENGKYFTYTLLNEGKYHTVVQNLKTRRNVDIEDAHDIAKVDFTSDGKYFILTFANATNPTQTLLYDPETKKQTSLSYYNLAGISAQEFVAPQPMSYISFDKTEIPGLLYMPKGAKVDSSLTMVALFQKHPTCQLRQEFNPLIQYLISQNFAVLVPAVRGAKCYGDEYSNADNGKNRLNAIRDAVQAAEWIKLSGLADPRKIVALGAGYGGFLAHHIAAQDSVAWAAAISINGYADLAQLVSKAPDFQKPLLKLEYGDPEIDSAFLKSISPLASTASLNKPTLMIYDEPNLQGDLTRRLKQYAAKVKTNEVVFESRLYPEGSLNAPEIMARVYEDIVRFIDLHVRYRK